MGKFPKIKETCGMCKHHATQRVGDSFDRGEAWYCFHPTQGKKREDGKRYFKDFPCVDEYRDAKDGDPEIPKWCPLPDINA